MHLTRPKSSKGRSRAAPSGSPCAGHSGGTQGPPGSPDSPGPCRPGRSLRSRSQPIMWQASQLSQDEVLQMLQHGPAAPPQSLNKYKVLPSIERRPAGASPGRGLDGDVSKLSLSDDAILQRGEPDPPTGDKGPDVHLDPPDPGATGRLLLAIRAPCGSRFQQHFDPTDTLQAVRASAEARYGARYGHASIETMDVPRRSLTDMDMTLAQCGILNRSVLCISQREAVEQD